MSAFNTAIQRKVRATSIEDKGEIMSTVDALVDLCIRLAEKKLNETSPKFKYESNHVGKSMFSFVREYLSKLRECRFFPRC